MFGFMIGMYLWSTLTPAVEFVPNKAVIRPASFPVLEALGATIVARGCASVEVRAHVARMTDYGMARDITSDRAKAVGDFLIAKAGVPAAIVITKGWGERSPRVPPGTPGADLINRRVEVILGGCTR